MKEPVEPEPARDDAGAQHTLREAHDRQVPGELIGQLHAANGRADELRRKLEAIADDGEYDHEARVTRVGEELRVAEREVEEVTGRIRDATPPAAKAGE